MKLKSVVVRRKSKLLLLLLLTITLQSNKSEEGMFPLSSLSGLDLQKAGLKISAKELYNPDGISLIDAVVRLGGCTGSFVSPDGLIITNHHCAFGAAASISDSAHDYITNGFKASTHEEERSVDLPVKITVSYQDVSTDVLQDANKIRDPVARIEAINEKIKQIELKERENNPGLLCEMSEMFTGKQYVLFRYKTIKDVRLVYVPPRSVGEYGGETDNWVWPRHSGDFSFVRAYVAPDGSAAAYSPSNVPYKPAKHFKINASTLKENDFVFILGYPGRTYRHQPSQFFEYHQDHQLPFISKVYDWQIAKMEELGKGNKNLELAYSSRVKQLANVTKNYKGKLQGFRRIGLLQNKIDEETAMQSFIESDPLLMEQYGTLLRDIDKIYIDKIADADKFLWLTQLMNTPGIFRASMILNRYRKENQALMKTKWEEIVISNATAIRSEIRGAYGQRSLEFDKGWLTMMFTDCFDRRLVNIFAGNGAIVNDPNPRKAISNFVRNIIENSYLNEPKKIDTLLATNPTKVFKKFDDLQRLSKVIFDFYIELDGRRMKQDAALNLLLSKYVEIKMYWKKQNFTPDANITLRFTYGYVRGYKPNDGEYDKPFTTLKGIIEKCDNTTFVMPASYQQLYEAKDYDKYMDINLGDLPVDFLYNMDTTGGNSGSPVLNAYGELVGVNFDRAYSATINDYAWNENYSRSVGCDIRYVCWVLKKVAHADNLLQELGQ